MDKKKITSIVTAKYAELCGDHRRSVGADRVIREDLREALVAEICKLQGCKIANRSEFRTVGDFVELIIRTRYKRLVGRRLVQMSRNVFGIESNGNEDLMFLLLSQDDHPGKTACRHFYAMVVYLLGVPRDQRRFLCSCMSIKEIAEYTAFKLWDMKKQHSLGG